MNLISIISAGNLVLDNIYIMRNFILITIINFFFTCRFGPQRQLAKASGGELCVAAERSG